MRPPLIDYPKQEQLSELLKKEKGQCVSLWMQTQEAGRETNQNAIRFKNLLSKASEQLKGGELSQRLESFATLEQDFDFWRHQSSGFAMYLCEGVSQGFRLAHDIGEGVHVGDEFMLRPLAPAFCHGNTALVLALSWDKARLYETDSHRFQELKIHSFPMTMEELVTARDPEKQLQYQSYRASGQQSGASDVAIYHGHGEGEGKIDADRDMYLSRVGHHLSEVVYDRRQPLILVATDEVAGHFTSTTDVSVAKRVAASPDGLSEAQLGEKVKSASHEVLEEATAAISDRLGTALAHDLGSKELPEIVNAAARGRIDTLLISSAEPVYGQFDPEQMSATVSETGDADLVNIAVRGTLAADGKIVTRRDDGSVPLAAIYRY